jgi:oligoribonuclease (3'-5' exoribonuclease)
MKYLSIDLEATGLEEHDQIIEFAMVPFDTVTQTFCMKLSKQFFVKCPSYEELKPKLNPWVAEHNEELIRKAHAQGVSQTDFKKIMHDYVTSAEVKEYFENQKIVLFGKSMSSIDLPFMTRDLGWEWMNEHFQHRNLDLSAVSYALMDMGLLPTGMDSGSKLMQYLDMGDVAHTALEDAVNTAKMYFKLLEKYQV